MKTICIALLCLALFSVSAFSSEDATTGSISGKISGKNGESLSGGKVLLFRADTGPVPAKLWYWRIPDEIVDIDGDGRFIAKVAEGSYHLAAIKRTTNESISPPREGDIIYPHNRKDLKSEQELYVVAKGKNTDIGVIAEAVPLTKQPVATDHKITAIEGTIVDTLGNPVPDAIAFAYTLPKFTGKALFASARTGNDGNYSLRVNEGGSYYIKIRTTREGGHPIEGEIIGVHGNDNPLAVKVSTGEIKTAVTVVGRPFKKQNNRRQENTK